MANRFSEQPRTHRVIEQIRFGKLLRMLNHGSYERGIGYADAYNQSSLGCVPSDGRLRWRNCFLLVGDRFTIHRSSPLLHAVFAATVVNRPANSSAFSATSRQPASIVS